MMNLFLLNIFLALGFSAVLGQLNLSGFVAGFVVGYLALWLSKPLYGQTRYFERLPGVFGLIGFFGKELLVSNFKVLWDVITPRHISRPEIMLVANLISLTPGTLSLDLSEDRRILYIHVMFLDDIEGTRQQIKQGLEKRVLEVMR